MPRDEKEVARARLKTLALRRNDIKKEIDRCEEGDPFKPIFQSFLDENLKESRELYQKTIVTDENLKRWREGQK